MCSTRCTAIYSLSGILFLLFVYTLLSTQPFFVTGINDIDAAKSSALGAVLVLVFVILFITSLVGICKGRGRRNNNDDEILYDRLNINLNYQMSGDDSSPSER